ncbi:MAG: hypothetical protein RQ729_01985 [Wenzhouxiangellaceae bacterium]|nr:hypothetical protein [Wenzhouxiangellaceae bacterium]
MNSRRAMLALAAMLAGPAVPAPVLALELELVAEQVQLGDWSLERVALTLGRDVELRVGPVQHADDEALGSIELHCPAHPGGRCANGTGRWVFRRDTLAELTLERSKAALAFNVELPSLARVPSSLLSTLGLSSLDGQLDIQARRVAAVWSAQLQAQGLAFDTPDGALAAADLALSAALEHHSAERTGQLALAWTAGELLVGPLYLPPPEQPWQFEATLQPLSDRRPWRVDVQMHRIDALDLSAGLTLDPAVARLPEALRAASIRLESLDLAWAWRHGLESLAAGYGFGGLRPSGRLALNAELDEEGLLGLQATLLDTALSDELERLAADGVNIRLDWQRDTAELALDWQRAALYRIETGPGALVMRESADGTLALQQPLRVPVLGGALLLEQLVWRDWRGAQPELSLSASVEPIDLARLTRQLGGTEFGGTLSGRIPSLHWQDQVLVLDGALELALFDGRARMTGLRLERPLGRLPALAADIELERLDLAQVTGAFEFGAMTGRMSGHIHELRLLDWQPVQFDAWFETHSDSPSREISEKAVNSLSTVSGGGGAALSGTLLKWFDTFPYARIGIGCRLERNVCTMRGLGPAEAGGYRILEGRLLPRLDIVAHKRRVDWPQLLAQLEAVTATE